MFGVKSDSEDHVLVRSVDSNELLFEHRFLHQPFRDLHRFIIIQLYYLQSTQFKHLFLRKVHLICQKCASTKFGHRTEWSWICAFFVIIFQTLLF